MVCNSKKKSQACDLSGKNEFLSSDWPFLSVLSFFILLTCINTSFDCMHICVVEIFDFSYSSFAFLGLEQVVSSLDN